MDQVIVTKAKNPVPAGYKPIYIGRPSILGNPYVIGDTITREEACKKYAIWAKSQMALKGVYWHEMTKLVTMLQAGDKLALQCFCAPMQCHGDFIKRQLDRRLQALTKGDSNGTI